MLSSRTSRTLRYGVAAGSVAVAVGLRVLLDPVLGVQLPFALLFLAILFTAWYGGFGPAVAAVVLGGFAAAFFFLAPQGSFAVAGADDRVGLVLYGCTGLGIAMLGGSMKAARGRAEAGAQAARSKAVLLDQTHDALLVWDWDGAITLWNRGAERLYGIPRTDALGRVSHELLQTRIAGGVESFLSVLQRDGSWEGELEHTTRDGRTITVETRMVLIREEGRLYVVETNRDITKRQAAEVAMRELETRVAERTVELQRQREELQLMLDTVPALIFYKDREHRLVRVNRELTRLMGMPREELEGRTNTELGSPDAAQYHRDEDEVLATGQPKRNLIEPLLTSSGVRWLQTDKIPHRDADGRIVGVIGFAVDITERKRAGEQLARMAAIVDSSGDAIIGKTLEGIITSWNPGAEKMFGFVAEEAVGQSMLMLIPPERASEEAVILARIGRGESVKAFETVRVRKDGQQIDVSVTISPITDGQGKIIGVSKIARDITERKRVEGALRESEARKAAVLETALDCIITMDRDGRIVEFNPAAERTFGRSRSEAIGAKMADMVIPPAWRERHQRGFAHYRATGEGPILGKRMELPALRADGSEFPAEIAINVIQVNGQPMFTASLRDITERKQAEAHIQKSNRELSDYLENSNVCLHWVGPDGIILWANRTEMEFLGYTKEEYIGQPISKFHADPPVIDDILQRLTRCEKLDGYGARLRAKDGSIKLVSINSSAYVEGEKFIHTRCFTLDITERKQAEAKLRESEESFRKMANSMLQLAWIAQPDGYIVWYNQRWYEYTGTTPEQMEGWGWQSVHDPQVLPRVMEEWKGAIAAGQPFDTAFPLRGADGKFRQFLTRALPLKDAEGRVVQWFGTNTDVDELKRVEDSLRKSEASLAAAQAGAKIGNWELDLATKTGTWSAEMFRLFDRDPALGVPSFTEFKTFPHPDDRETFAGLHEAAVAAGRPYEQDFRVIRPDGTIRWIAGRAEMILDADRKPVSMVGTAQDITERKLAEEEVQKVNTELERRVIERTAQLAAANKELEAFSYSVSHDLRAPLRGVNGYVGMIREDYADRLDAEGNRMLNVVASEARRMGQLIDDLLAFSRLGRQTMGATLIEMTSLVRGEFENLTRVAPESAPRFDLPPLPPVYGDPAMLRQVFANLLSNAIKFSRQQTSPVIEVGSRSGEGEITFYVKDNGAGFDERYRHKLFGVFQRLHTEEEFEGTGVGLALVQRVIHRHGGRVWAESKLHEGATFFFTLPTQPKTI